MKKHAPLAVLLAAVLLFSLCAALPASAGKNLTVTCGSVSSNRRLKTVCAASSAGGKNQSPAISWSAVPEAAAYAVYIFDTSAGNWCHWKALISPDKTSLKQGENPGQYKVPYPPSGTHRYQITVYALAKKPSSLPGKFDGKNTISTVEKGLGTILASGSVTVSYAKGDNNK